MRKFSLGVTLCLSILFLALLAGDAFAQGTPSSKATAAINTSVACAVKGTSNMGDPVPVDCHDVFSGDAV